MENTRILKSKQKYLNASKKMLRFIYSFLFVVQFGHANVVKAVILSNDETNSPVILLSIPVDDPVDIKCSTSNNLYVLSAASSTLTEFDSNGKVIRLIAGIGSVPSGFDVDSFGDVFVVLMGDNQVRKLKPNHDSFEFDGSFALNGALGGFFKNRDISEDFFKQPRSVALSGDQKEIFVSDSGNNRIVRLTTEGKYIESYNPSNSEIGPFKTPGGLVCVDYDEPFITDTGNSRIVLAAFGDEQKVYGSYGTGEGQFRNPSNLSANERGIYIADTGNNRIEVLGPLRENEVSIGGVGSSLTYRCSLSTGLSLNQPKSVTAGNDLIEERVYIADTRNNRVILVRLPSDNPEGVWKQFVDALQAGDVPKINSFFCMRSVDRYTKQLNAESKAQLKEDADSIRSIMPIKIMRDNAQYYFKKKINGDLITFRVEFYKEDGQWKIFEF